MDTTIWGLGIQIAQYINLIMEHQMEKRMENEMETKGL